MKVSLCNRLPMPPSHRAILGVGREGIEPPLLIEEPLFYKQLGLPSPIDPGTGLRNEARGMSKAIAPLETSSLKPHPSSLINDAGGIRTRNREGLSFAAVPVRVPRLLKAIGFRL